MYLLPQSSLDLCITLMCISICIELVLCIVGHYILEQHILKCHCAPSSGAWEAINSEACGFCEIVCCDGSSGVGWKVKIVKGTRSPVWLPSCMQNAMLGRKAESASAHICHYVCDYLGHMWVCHSGQQRTHEVNKSSISMKEYVEI